MTSVSFQSPMDKQAAFHLAVPNLFMMFNKRFWVTAVANRQKVTSSVVVSIIDCDSIQNNATTSTCIAHAAQKDWRHRQWIAVPVDIAAPQHTTHMTHAQSGSIQVEVNSSFKGAIQKERKCMYAICICGGLRRCTRTRCHDPLDWRRCETLNCEQQHQTLHGSCH